MTGGRWPRRAVVAAGATGVLFVVLWQSGVVPAPWHTGVVAVALTGLVVFVTGWTFADRLDDLAPASWFGVHDVEPPPVRAGMDRRLGRLRHQLHDTVERDDRPDAVHGLLRELTAERLAARGIDLDANPQAAEAVMHPTLVHYLNHPPQDTKPCSRRMLADVVGRIEEL